MASQLRENDFGRHMLIVLVCCAVFAIGVLLILKFSQQRGTFKDILANRGTTFVVTTSTGDVLGVPLDVYNVTVRAFYGIPYALPPRNGRRFSHPIAAYPWKGVHDGTAINARCPQRAQEYYFGRSSNVSIDEDCLYMNLYAPMVSHSGSASRAVVVVLHGGGFSTGSNVDDLYDARYLAALGEVVVAVPNFRLNVFGFLRTTLHEAQGNQGLWDQLLAIQWIYVNARVFGGKEDTLTLLGVDSGAVAAGLHMLSPVSRPYIKRAIMQGGSPFLVTEQVLYARKAEFEALARDVCFSGSHGVQQSEEELLGCLKNASSWEILSNLDDFDGIHGRVFGPSYYDLDTELYITAINKNINKAEKEILMDKDILIGFTANEGEYFLRQFFSSWSLQSVNRFPRAFVTVFQERLVLQYYSQRSLGSLFEYYYDRKNGISYQDSYIQACRFLGDVLVKCPVKMMADYVSRSGGNVFVYEFDYHLSPTLLNTNVLNFKQWLGATHYVDVLFSLGYFFRLAYTRPVDNDTLSMSRRIIQKWAVFAESGVPDRRDDVKWPQYNVGDKKMAVLLLNKLRQRNMSELDDACGRLLKNAESRTRTSHDG
ncbi:cholinesterase 1-like [Ornithodoros turicata]|uniref:cholinesterase 1-like n=1 Tax=Ornithodoros turicata TaxID=34597 RepID=UPI003139C0A0